MASILSRARCFALAVFTLCLTLSPALSQAGGGTGTEVSPNYRLSVRDLVRFRVVDETETQVEQRIDGEGRIGLPYIQSVNIAGLTVREAEELIEQTYIDKFIYKKLQANLQVLEYAPKVISVLGQVKSPGRIAFPIETNRINILDVITEAGGLTNVARSREVRITRNSGASEEIFTVNVERMLTGRGDGDGSSFYVEPGDVIFVPEKLF